jgi:hypothetical protein
MFWIKKRLWTNFKEFDFPLFFVNFEVAGQKSKLIFFNQKTIA